MKLCIPSIREFAVSGETARLGQKAETDAEKTYVAKWDGGIPWESGSEGSGGQMQRDFFFASLRSF